MADLQLFLVQKCNNVTGNKYIFLHIVQEQLQITTSLDSKYDFNALWFSGIVLVFLSLLASRNSICKGLLRKAQQQECLSVFVFAIVIYVHFWQSDCAKC